MPHSSLFILLIALVTIFTSIFFIHAAAIEIETCLSLIRSNLIKFFLMTSNIINYSYWVFPIELQGCDNGLDYSGKWKHVLGLAWQRCF